jgi:hypothetical protein
VDTLPTVTVAGVIPGALAVLPLPPFGVLVEAVEAVEGVVAEPD